MEGRIKCKHCGKVVAADDPLIAAARNGEGESSQFITCECGQRISFWDVTAQIRDQNKPLQKIIDWVQSLFKEQG